MPGPLEDGHHVGPQDLLGCPRRHPVDQGGHGVRAGRIARGELPDLAHALELADVEGVETDQVARPLRVDVRVHQSSARPFGHQSVRRRSGLQPCQPLPPRLQPVAPEDPVDAGATDPPPAPAPLAQLGGNPGGPVRGPEQRIGQHGVLEGRDGLTRPSDRPGRARQQPIGPVSQKTLAPSIEHRAGDPGFVADLGHIAELGGALQDRHAMMANAVLEGHTLLPPSEACQASVGGSGGRVVTLFS
jgi:hypothetical protein